MIEVSELTKRYPGRTAVNGISFTVGRGEVVGFLGPNGAGKSTTMRMLAAFLPGTSGTARVAGFDVFHEPDEVRRRIGYMPENNPLHLDMRVRDYLKFRARLKGLGWRRSRRARGHRAAAVRIGGRAVPRIIGQLSKGYRQRVGLADALVHEPDLIILDEPTIGLDPHQIRAVRSLIKDLGKEAHRAALVASPERGRDDLFARAHPQPRRNHRRRHDRQPRESGSASTARFWPRLPPRPPRCAMRFVTFLTSSAVMWNKWTAISIASPLRPAMVRTCGRWCSNSSAVTSGRCAN